MSISSGHTGGTGSRFEENYWEFLQSARYSSNRSAITNDVSRNPWAGRNAMKSDKFVRAAADMEGQAALNATNKDHLRQVLKCKKASLLP